MFLGVGRVKLLGRKAALLFRPETQGNQRGNHTDSSRIRQVEMETNIMG